MLPAHLEYIGTAINLSGKISVGAEELCFAGITSPKRNDGLAELIAIMAVH